MTISFVHNSADTGYDLDNGYKFKLAKIGCGLEIGLAALTSMEWRSGEWEIALRLRV